MAPCAIVQLKAGSRYIYRPVNTGNVHRAHVHVCRPIRSFCSCFMFLGFSHFNVLCRPTDCADVFLWVTCYSTDSMIDYIALYWSIQLCSVFNKLTYLHCSRQTAKLTWWHRPTWTVQSTVPNFTDALMCLEALRNSGNRRMHGGHHCTPTTNQCHITQCHFTTNQ